MIRKETNRADRRQKKKDGVVASRRKGYSKKAVNTRFGRREDLEQKNNHINFKREGKKTSARKDLTNVICIKCGKEFVLPFKPRRPDVYCDTCFKNKNKIK